MADKGKKLCWGCIVEKPIKTIAKTDDYTNGICKDCRGRLQQELKIEGYKIELTDREPVYSHWYGRDTITTDVHITIREGKKFFLRGYTKGGSVSETDGIFGKIRQFVNNGGRFMTFYGPGSPFVLLTAFDEAGEEFGEAYSCELSYLPSMKIWEFHGNGQRVSAAFHYRIYSKEYAKILAKVLRGRKNVTIDLSGKKRSATRKGGEKS